MESFVYATEKLHNIESNKLWNYRKRPRSGLRLRVSFEPERVRESAICYITHWLWLAFDHSIESDSKLQRFFIFFRFSNNSFHFSTFHWLVRSPCLVSPWPAGRFKLIYAFLSSISRKMTHTQLPYRFHFDPACFQHCAVRNASNDTNIFAIQIEWNCSTFHSDDFFMLKQCP